MEVGVLEIWWEVNEMDEIWRFWVGFGFFCRTRGGKCEIRDLKRGEPEEGVEDFLFPLYFTT